MPSTAFPVGTAHVIGRTLTPEPERELPEDPVKWAQDDLDMFLWSKQRQIMRSVVANRRTYVPSCNGPGKTLVAAITACWWIEGHPPGEAVVVSSAPTDDQIGALLWKEIRRAHARGNLVGRTNLNNQWYIGPPGEEELVAYGRKPQDMADPAQAMQRFQGTHARYVLVILDEATGVPAWLWDAIKGLLTNETARLLAIGNPDDPTSAFEERCRPGSDGNVIPISIFDTPNFTDEAVPEYLREMLPSRLWADEMLREYGEDHAWYQSKVLGRFPDTSEDRVISPKLVKAAQARDLPGTGRGAFGLDVGRLGSDHSALYRDRDGVVRLVEAWRKMPTTAMRLAVQRHLAKVPDVPIGVDADGLGAGPYDEMRADGVRAVPFTMQSKIHNPRRFANRRSEMWWLYRETMQDGLIDLDPADDRLAAQLQQPKWSYDGRGRIKVESKDEMKRRGVGSPDFADAAIIAWFTASSPAVRLGRENAPTLQGPRRGSKMITAGLRERRF